MPLPSLLAPGVSDQVDPEDPSARWAIVVRPTGMNAGVAADKRSVVHSESVRVTRVGSEVHRLQHLAGGGVVLD